MNVSAAKHFPMFSIITVVYNGEAYLEQTIRSVLEQSYGNVEYIIIDGASTDGTLGIAERYRAGINVLVSEKDRGIYDAMNKGILLASGDFVAFVNADDWLEPDALESVAALIADRPEVEFVYGDINVVSDDGSYVWKGNAGRHTRGESIPHPACFMKRVLLEQTPFDLRYRLAADYELIVRVVRQGHKMAYLGKTVANFRVGGASSNFGSRREVFLVNRMYFGMVYALKRLSMDVLFHLVNSLKAKFRWL